MENVTIPYGVEINHETVDMLFEQTDKQGFRFGNSTNTVDLPLNTPVKGVVKTFIIAEAFEGQTKGKLYCIMEEDKTGLRYRFGVTQSQFRELPEETPVLLKVAEFKPTRATDNNPTKKPVKFMRLEKIGAANVNAAFKAVEAEKPATKKPAAPKKPAGKVK